MTTDAPPDAPAASPRVWESGVVALACAASLWIYARANYVGIALSDDFEYASVARNLLRGRGFAAQHILPVELQFWSSAVHPDFIHPPGTPALIAASFALFGIGDFQAVLPMMACFVAAGVLTFLIARQVGGRSAGWLAALVYSLHPSLLRWGVVALSETPTALVVATSLWLALRSADRPGGRAPFVIGLLLGLGAALRENVPIYLPGALAAAGLFGLGAIRSPEGRRKLVAAVAGTAVGIAPMVARSLIDAGRPWFSYSTYHVQGYSSLYQEVEIFRHLNPPTFLASAVAHPEVLRHKIAGIVLGAPGTLLAAADVPLALLFAAGLAVARDGAQRRLRDAVLVQLFAHFAVLSVFVANPRHLAPLMPGMIAVGACGGAALLAGMLRTGPRHGWIPAAFVALLLAAEARTWSIYCRSDWRKNQWEKVPAFVEANVPPDGLVMTDSIEAVVWRADRNAATIPVDRPGFEHMVATLAPTHLLLTSRLRMYPKSAWMAEMQERGDIPGFRESARFEDGTWRAVLYRRE